LLVHHWEEAGEAWPAALWHRRAAEWAGVTSAAEARRRYAEMGATAQAERLAQDLSP